MIAHCVRLSMANYWIGPKSPPPRYCAPPPRIGQPLMLAAWAGPFGAEGFEKELLVESLLDVELYWKNKRKKEKQPGLPGLPIKGPVKTAKWLWRLALAYFPHCSQWGGRGFESHLVHQILKCLRLPPARWIAPQEQDGGVPPSHARQRVLSARRSRG